ncbi:MAG TPA: pyridoxal phosphate-dependent aminotransferase [candidate division Zixibacteria bacterium]|nr:pyridoxal phosphate-dependent aminotransferase [candidate division Zixibacteria bacterium]
MVPKKVVIEKADRLYQLPPELAAFLPEKARRSLIRKTPATDLATFSWPIAFDEGDPAPPARLGQADREQLARLRSELAAWYQTRFGVRLHPDKEICIGGGVTILTMALATAFVDRGDAVLVPEIGLPLYRRAAVACGGEPIVYRVSPKNGWQPDFEPLESRVGKAARLLFLNSPHNPTGAVLGERELGDLLALAARHQTGVINDAAYLTLAPGRPASLLALPGGRRNGAEIGSFSYLFGLPRLPLGFVAGNRDIISGVRHALRLAPPFLPAYAVERAIAAVRQFPGEPLRRLQTAIAASRAEAVRLVDRLGLAVSGYDTVPFLWARLERRRSAAVAAGRLYLRGRILALPGTAFGDSGEGYLRFSLTAPAELYAQAGERLRRRPHLLRPPEDS